MGLGHKRDSIRLNDCSLPNRTLSFILSARFTLFNNGRRLTIARATEMKIEANTSRKLTDTYIELERDR